jgi:hypothetical protein
MTNLVAIAATADARQWWRAQSLAARWRDRSKRIPIVDCPPADQAGFLYQVKP